MLQLAWLWSGMPQSGDRARQVFLPYEFQSDIISNNWGGGGRKKSQTVFLKRKKNAESLRCIPHKRYSSISSFPCGYLEIL